MMINKNKAVWVACAFLALSNSLQASWVKTVKIFALGSTAVQVSLQLNRYWETEKQVEQAKKEFGTELYSVQKQALRVIQQAASDCNSNTEYKKTKCFKSLIELMAYNNKFSTAQLIAIDRALMTENPEATMAAERQLNDFSKSERGKDLEPEIIEARKKFNNSQR